MDYEFTGFNVSKKDEEKVEKVAENYVYMMRCFLNGVLFPLTVPYYFYRKLKHREENKKWIK